MELRLILQRNETAFKLHDKLKPVFEQAQINEVFFNEDNFISIRMPKNNSSIHRIINPPRAILNALDQDKYCRILNINNLPCGNTVDESIIKTYEVMLWGFNCLSLKVWSSARERGRTKPLKEKDNPKVVDTARRILYLLGLDFARLVISYTARRRYKVSSIDPSPYLSEKMMDVLVQRFLDLSNLDQRVMQRDIKLGADPEFMMFNSRTGKIVSASNHFPREGMVGCDNIRMPNRTQRPVAEVRPKPDYSPLVLTANIKQALSMANQMAPYQGVRWAAGSQPGGGFSIGGHIHFSNIRVNSSLLRALDNFLGLPIFLIENPASAVRRRKRYGQLGDYRTKDYGGFEYRTPGSWLVSQNITLAVLCLAKIVVSRYPWLPYNYLNSVESQRSFYQGNKEHFYPIFERLWSHIEAIDLYQDYKIHLQVLYDMIMSQGTWNESQDFRRAWMIPGGGRKTRNTREKIADAEDIPGANSIQTEAVESRPSNTPAVRTPGAGPGVSSRGRIINANQVRRTHRVR